MSISAVGVVEAGCVCAICVDPFPVIHGNKLFHSEEN